jgi:hypothetical protein
MVWLVIGLLQSGPQTIRGRNGNDFISLRLFPLPQARLREILPYGPNHFLSAHLAEGHDVIGHVAFLVDGRVADVGLADVWIVHIPFMRSPGAGLSPPRS